MKYLITIFLILFMTTLKVSASEDSVYLATYKQTVPITSIIYDKGYMSITVQRQRPNEEIHWLTLRMKCRKTTTEELQFLKEYWIELEVINNKDYKIKFKRVTVL